MFLDLGAGFLEFSLVSKQAGAVKMDICQVERHGAALGDLLRLVQKAPRCLRVPHDRVMMQRGGEESSWQVLSFVGFAESLDCECEASI